MLGQCGVAESYLFDVGNWDDPAKKITEIIYKLEHKVLDLEDLLWAIAGRLIDVESVTTTIPHSTSFPHTVNVTWHGVAIGDVVLNDTSGDVEIESDTLPSNFKAEVDISPNGGWDLVVYKIEDDPNKLWRRKLFDLREEIVNIAGAYNDERGSKR
jgi:hypothetical protein